MRLLAKQQLQDDLSLQKKIEIDNGIAIARKVDVLRETLATLEQSHKDFIAHSTEERKLLLGQLDYEINEKKKELERLDEQRKILLEPLDGEWKILREAQEEHTLNIENLSLKQNELSQKEKRITEEEKRIEKDTAIASDARRQAEQKLGQASKELKDAERISLQAKRYSEQIHLGLREEQDAMSNKMQDFNSWANALDKREILISAKEKQLVDKERFINDKYNTLIRTIKRLN